MLTHGGAGLHHPELRRPPQLPAQAQARPSRLPARHFAPGATAAATQRAPLLWLLTARALCQALLAILDSPLNKAGRVKARRGSDSGLWALHTAYPPFAPSQGVFVRTQKNVLFSVSPTTRLPRTFKRFCGLMRTPPLFLLPFSRLLPTHSQCNSSRSSASEPPTDPASCCG